jgi:hypothetical protein
MAAQVIFHHRILGVIDRARTSARTLAAYLVRPELRQAFHVRFYDRGCRFVGPRSDYTHDPIFGVKESWARWFVVRRGGTA